ncbi:MAG: gluconate 2-dehydrogenase subunit 3 family protein [Deltaproteobacteria bacterium]|nr:gluconate 2-dehydrogenase subunit 3 family protein [Deltaproteobacteria bacterium]
MLTWIAVGAAFGYAIARIGLGYPAPRVRTERLLRSEVAFLSAAADALFPRGGPIEPSGTDAGVPAYVDRYLGDVPPKLALLMRCLFLLFEHASFVVRAPGRGGMRRFSSLSPAQRVAVLERWQRARLFPMRLVFTSLRAILTMGYFASPEVLRTLHLAPYAIATPVTEADLLYPPIGKGPEAIRWGPADLTAPSDGSPIPIDAPLHPAYAEALRA